MESNALEFKQLFFVSPQKTMEIVLDTIREIIPYELAVILSKEENNNLKVRYARGPLVTEKIKEFEILLKERPDIEKVLEIGNVKLVDETSDEHHHDTYEEVLDLPTGHSCMLVPLRVNEDTLGLMTLDHSQCDIFTPQRVSIANSLSKLIALALAQAIATDSLKSEKETLIYERTSLMGDITTVIDGLIGNIAVWQQVIQKIKLVSPTESHVMVLGETGTGKEQVAKAIHSLSSRAHKPFITLNCSALNFNLAESELFGHDKGAFTGAISSRRGRFELAEGGILFLDEIGDLPLDIQPKLLRAIQQGTFERLGSEKTIYADVRIICATNVDLENKVKEGKFREDLFYRLNVFPIILPPLRFRKDDIYLLANHFLEKLAFRFKKKNLLLLPDAVNKLKENYWHGNVRELQNTLERALILSKNGIIDASHIVFENKEIIEKEVTNFYQKNISFDEATRKIILQALEHSNGKIYGANGAAAILKLKPTTLQSKMKKLKILL